MIQSLFSLACGECGLFLQAMPDDKHDKERGVDSIGIRLPAGGREISKLNSIVADRELSHSTEVRGLVKKAQLCSGV